MMTNIGNCETQDVIQGCTEKMQIFNICSLRNQKRKAYDTMSLQLG